MHAPQSSLRQPAHRPQRAERRVALVNAVRHKWHNPLVLRPTLLRQPRYADVLSMRLRGGRASLQPSTQYKPVVPPPRRLRLYQEIGFRGPGDTVFQGIWTQIFQHETDVIL